MTGILDLPNEVLLQVFEIGCDKKYLDSCRLLPTNRFPHWQFPSRSSVARHRKDFVKAVSDVCKRWMDLVDSTPQFWVTRIAIGPYPETSWAECAIEMIENSSGSDLDIHLTMPQETAGRFAVEIGNLFKQYLLPLSPRWRCCLYTESSEPEGLGFIWNTLRNDLPRLVMLRLSIVPCALVKARIRLPKLMFVAMDHFSHPQSVVPFPFTALKSIRLSQTGERLSVDQGAAIAALRLSSTTLTHLKLYLDVRHNLTELNHATPADDKLILQSLEELRIESFYLETVLKLLGLCSLPKLERLFTSAGSDGHISHTQEIQLPQVNWLSCSFNIGLFEQFFAVVKTPLLSSLVLYVKGDWESPAQQPHAVPLFVFPQLELCDVKWYTEKRSDATLADFITLFDLESVRFLRIQIGVRAAILNVEFATRYPDMRRICTKDVICLFFMMPSLPRDLSVEERSRVIRAASDSWERLRVDSPLQVKELRVRTSHIFPLPLSLIARPFANVESVWLNCRSLTQPDRYGHPFATILDKKAAQARAIPKLDSLHISFPKTDERFLTAGIEHLKRFVTERYQAGHPIGRVRVPALPTESDHSAWFRLHVPDFSELDSGMTISSRIGIRRATHGWIEFVMHGRSRRFPRSC